MNCNKCGEKLSDNDTFCPGCGAPADRTPARHSAPAPSARPGRALKGITVCVIVLAVLAAAAVLTVIFLQPGKNASVPEPTEAVETEAPTEDPFSISKSEIEAETERIRTYYYSPGIEDRRTVLENGADGVNYSREYYYHNSRLVFAFIYDGSEEHRLYFKDDRLIRYIDENRETFDYPDTDSYYVWETKALSEAYAKIGDAERYMFVSKWLGKWEASDGESLEIYKVDDDGIILTFRKKSEQGGMINADYEMEFDNEERTAASELGGPEDHGGWEYTFELSNRYITVKSRYPDQVFYKK